MGSGPESIRELLQTARDQIQRGEREQALATYRKALELDPDNQQIMERISIVEREIAAMEKFNRSRTSRAHTAGRNISSSGFVDDCVSRSEEALQAGDPVRALQELERARRHDPDNSQVKQRIEFVRMYIKVDGLADMVRNRLGSGDPAGAVENLRMIFEQWPSAPVLDELLKQVEDYREPAVKKEEKAAPAAAAPAAPAAAGRPPGRKPATRVRKPAPEPAEEKKEPERNKLVPIIMAAALLIGLVIAGVIIFGGKEPEPEVIEYVPPEPFTTTVVLPGIEDASLTYAGETVRETDPGVFVISDTVFSGRTIRVSAPGFETMTWDPVFREGVSRVDTLQLDTLGTSDVTVTFLYQMAEGTEDPGAEAVRFLVDGESVEGNTATIKTGERVFQALADGYRTMPESVLVAETSDFSQTLNVLAAEQAQVTLQLAADTPGNAIFYVDGARVGTGRRMSEVLPFGRYSLLVQMDGREDFGVTINLDEEGYSRTVSLAEIQQTGRLTVGPEPWSNVYVNGDLVGTTPFGGVDLEPGTYTVRLSNPDFRDDVRTVEIVAGETRSIQYNAVALEQTEETVEDTVAVFEPQEELPISQPFPIQQPAPVVPPQARARGDISGYVTLAVVVGTDGSVRNVTVVSDPIGLGCGQAAADAVRNWVFSPAMQGDQPVEVTTNVQIRFDIE